MIHISISATPNPETEKMIAVSDTLNGQSITDVIFFETGFNDAGQIYSISKYCLKDCRLKNAVA